MNKIKNYRNSFSKDTSILSPTEDGILFLVGPFFLTVLSFYFMKLIPGINYSEGYQPSAESLLFWNYILMTFFEFPHTALTFLRAYRSGANHKSYFDIRWAPIFIYLLIFILFRFPRGIFNTLALYVAVFHGIRQQYGFMRYATHREMGLSSFDRFLDGSLIYLILGLTFVWYHSYLSGPGWDSPNDIVHLPLWVGDFSMSFLGLFICFYLGRQLLLYLRLRRLNYTKWLVILSSMAFFYLPYMYMAPPFCHLPFRFLHTFPYIYLMLTVYQRSHPKTEKVFFGSPLVRSIAFYCFATVIGLAITRLVSFSSKNSMMYMMIEPLPFLVGFSHYFFDAFIWRSSQRKNFDLHSIFRWPGMQVRSDLI